MRQTSKNRFAVVAPAPCASGTIPQYASFTTFREPREVLVEEWSHIFVLTSLADLPGMSDFLRAANRRHRLRAVLVDRGRYFGLFPQFLHHAQVRTLRNMFVHEGPELPWRVLNAHHMGAEHVLIADAQVIDDQLFMVSCASEAYEVPFDSIPALRSIPEAQRQKCRVSCDGAFVHWPTADVHLDLDSVKRRLDPVWAQRKLAEDALGTASAGRAVAAVRRASNLRQSDIPGLSARQVRRIEHGESSTLTALERLASAHALDLATYVDRIAEMARSLA
jgi:uncharacterized protein DUF2442